MLLKRIKDGLRVFLMIFFFSRFAFGFQVTIDGSTKNFQYKRSVTVQASKVSGTSHSNFPMLFNSTLSYLATTGNGGKVQNSNGYDIVFAESDGSEILKHEIEKYVATTGEYVAWIKIPTLSGSSNTTIYMYFGSTDVSGDTQHAPDVWDSNFKMVQHLEETSGQHLDSTSNNNDSTSVSVTTQGSATGQINGADGFDGSDDYVKVSDDNSLDITSVGTIEAWMNSSGDGRSIGDITDTSIDTFIFGPEGGEPSKIMHLSGNVYVVVYTDCNIDGWVKTVEIADDGSITDTAIDSLEFDTAKGNWPDIVHVSGNVYAIAYQGPGSNGWLETVEIATDGTITDTVIDSLEFDIADCNFPEIIHVSGNVYAIAYKGTDADGFLVTVEIATDGTIKDTVLDSLEFDTAKGNYPEIIHVSGNIFAIAYQGPGNDGWLKTFNIATDGTITDTPVDSLEFEEDECHSLDIIHVSGNVYAISYLGSGTSPPVTWGGMINTVGIETDGTISDTIIDTLVFDDVTGEYSDMIHVSDGVYAVAYLGPDDDGFLKTVEIATDGTITDSIIDTLEFDPDVGNYPSLVHVADDVFAVAYTGTSSWYGVLETIEIVAGRGVFKVGAYGIEENTSTASATINNNSISCSISSGWNHVVLTYDKDAGSDQQKLYINGSLELTDTLTETININTNNLFIGKSLNGTIDEVRISNTIRNGDWILTSYNNQISPSTFYSIGTEATLIELSYFNAESLDSEVLLEWRTKTELDTEGFNLWRSRKLGEEYVKINPFIIPSKGVDGFGAEYSYIDSYVENGGTYFYFLEDIDIYGISTFHGPVSATPNDIMLIQPVEWRPVSLDKVLFSWRGSGYSYFKVDISSSPDFSDSEILAFPKDGWTSIQSLWLSPEERMMILKKARSAGWQLFWRVSAKGEDEKVICSSSRKFFLEKLTLPENNQKKKNHVRLRK